MNRAVIQERRDALAAEQERDELAYARLEEQIKALQADLAAKSRTMDMRHGAIGALDSVLSLPDEVPAPPRRAAWGDLREQFVRLVRVKNGSGRS